MYVRELDTRGFLHDEGMGNNESPYYSPCNLILKMEVWSSGVSCPPKVNPIIHGFKNRQVASYEMKLLASLG
jgi:hypothetical protein